MEISLLKTYLSAIAWIAAFAVVYGYVCPMLISASSTIAVLIGFVLLFGCIPAFWHFGGKIFREIVEIVKSL